MLMSKGEYLVNAKDIQKVLKKDKKYKDYNLTVAQIAKSCMKREPAYYDDKGIAYWDIYLYFSQTYEQAVSSYIAWLDKTKEPTRYRELRDSIHLG